MGDVGHSGVKPRLNISMIGTRGVPARYGGFETAIEEVGRRLAARGHQITVYCRGTEPQQRQREHLGMRLVHLPALKKRSLETLSHTALSVIHALFKRPDAALVFNAANSPLLPVLALGRIPAATHVDGLEWKRAKWGPAGQRYYLICERLAVWWSNELIADAQGIADYYTKKFSAPTRLITYGAPRLSSESKDRIGELGLMPGGYHLVVARFEPENHVEMIVRGYAQSNAKLPLIVVGSAPYAQAYTQQVHEAASASVKFLGGVWDQELLDELYAQALVYWHGHSVGGTNPSLLRAIGAGTAVNAFDVNFNREVLRDSGEFFTNSQDVARLVEQAEHDRNRVQSRAAAALERAGDYDWEKVADAYEALCLDLARKKRAFSARARSAVLGIVRRPQPAQEPVAKQ
ncbi:glycosyltransferase [Glutamicibacter sp. HZAU]|uniref:glycosyltransferase n=1 Tax=Glutamicibacter sp. HZAU TaxID=2049891 RepID=UPI00191BDE04|nr:glycosyltransferase [Glutamicibacter sp. HZAU]